MRLRSVFAQMIAAAAILMSAPAGFAADRFCHDPAELCWDAAPKHARFVSRFAKAMAKFASKTGTMFPILGPEAHKRATLRAFEDSVLEVVGWTRAEFDDRVSLVRQTLVQAILANPALQEKERTLLVGRAKHVPVRLPSDAQPSRQVSGCLLFMSNAFSVAPAPRSFDSLSPWELLEQEIERTRTVREVVVCPAWLLNEEAKPGELSSSLDFVVAHEIGHQLSTDNDGFILSLYRPFWSCTQEILGQARSADQMDESIADFWGAEVISRLYAGVPRDELRDAASGTMAGLCPEPETKPKTPQEAATEIAAELAKVHLPGGLRQQITLVHHPKLNGMLGCGPTPEDDFEFETCDLGPEAP